MRSYIGIFKWKKMRKILMIFDIESQILGTIWCLPNTLILKIQ